MIGLVQVCRNPWKEVCRKKTACSQITTHGSGWTEPPQGIKTSSEFQHAAARSESPALSHLLTHEPSHADRHARLDTAGSTRPHVSCQTFITCFLALAMDWMMVQEKKEHPEWK